MKYCIWLVMFASVSGQSYFAQTSRNPSHLQSLPASSLVGKWIEHSTEYSETRRVSRNSTEEITSRILCNVCPEIEFKADSTVTVKPQESDVAPKTAFMWGVKGNAVIIRTLTGADTQTAHFAAGQYTVDTQNARSLGFDGKSIVLTDNKGVHHILRRRD